MGNDIRDWVSALFLGLGLAITACTDRTEPSPPPPAAPAPEAELQPRAEQPATAELTDTPSQRWHPLVIVEPALMQALEANGLDLASRLEKPEAKDLGALAEHSPIYRRIVEAVEDDRSLAEARDPHAGVGETKPHHIFNPRVLRSPGGHFELVGLVNRMDRQPQVGGCGEVRLIYRLAHESLDGPTRLPMTLNLVYLREGDCRAQAQQWLSFSEDLLTRERLEGTVLEELPSLARVEFNLQSVRWPAASRPGLGGHAEYILRVLNVEDGEAKTAPLENTPTVTMDGEEVHGLRKLLRSSVAQIADGTLLLPDELLAVRSVSVAPRGSARLANRPFTQVLGDADELFAGVDLGPLRTPERAMRRLNTMSCKGCHQSRSMAGFHLIGENGRHEREFNRVAVGLSPHLLDELPYRMARLKAVAEGASTNAPRPFAEHGTDTGLRGAPCGLPDGAFADWTCTEGLICVGFDSDGSLGCCASEAGPGPGDRVEISKIYAHRKAFKDRVDVVDQRPTASLDGTPLKVASSGNGFPGGMAHAPCEQLGQERGQDNDRFVCAALPFSGHNSERTFTQCIFRDKQPVSRCAAESARPTWLRYCDREHACREDYLCAQVKVSAEGACVPPYFLGQLRVDGHGFRFSD